MDFDLNNGVGGQKRHSSTLYGRDEHSDDNEMPGSSKRQRLDKFEPVAVIGLAVKFPQDADCVQGFWETLMQAKSLMTEVPSDRWNRQAFCSEEGKQVNHFNVRGGHFVREDIALFDAPFFSINPAEAACMDPQQRALLETSYHALENAGIPLHKAAGSKTGVYIGCSSREYEDLLMRDHDVEAKYIGTGSHFSMLANRLSWFFDLSGPSLALDTACSSSLLAVHLACQSLYTGNSKMALVGGSNLIFNPDGMWPMANLNFLSPDGRCYSFDQRANGYSRGEGTGVVILKPLTAAIQDGDTIRAVIRATGSNQDGWTPSITQPSGAAQERLIRETYNSAGLGLDSTRFFEAHATGTVVGDPIEAGAIASVFAEHRSTEAPLYVGAVKTNIGHLEGASGIAGLIKTILVLESGIIPPNTNFSQPNPKLDLKNWNIKLPLAPTIWPAGLRRASVNSFGFGGTNTHVVVDDAFYFLQQRRLFASHSTAESPKVSMDRPRVTTMSTHSNRRTTNTPRLVALSAFDQKGIERLAKRYSIYLSGIDRETRNDMDYFEHLVYTLTERRTVFQWKTFSVVSNLDQLQKYLSQPTLKSSRPAKNNTIGFVFTGQGAQWKGMARELMHYRVFVQSVREADSYFSRLGCSWSVLDQFLDRPHVIDIDDPAVCQPICTVLQVAMVELLRSWGITANASIGHSSGEIAAAYCNKLITKEAAWKIAYYRGIVAARSQELALVPGGMMAVGMSEEEWKAIQRDLPENSTIVVACYNSQKSLTLSGNKQELEGLRLLLERRGTFNRLLKIPISYHSPSMNKVAKEYLSLIRHVSAPQTMDDENLPLFSTVFNSVLPPTQATKPEYWVENLVSPVLFSEALTTMIESVPNLNLLVEIGPQAALKRPVTDLIAAKGKTNQISYLSALALKRNSQETVLTLAGELFSRGYDVIFAAINSSQQEEPSRCTLTDLPQYPFNHNARHWQESRLSKEYRFRRKPVNPLLGSVSSESTTLAPIWRHFIRRSELDWVQDHTINHVVIYPAGGMLVMAIEALRELIGTNNEILAFRLKDIQITRAMQIPEHNEGLETNTKLAIDQDAAHDKGLQWYRFSISSCDNDIWSENCRGMILAETSSTVPANSHSRTKTHEKLLKEFWQYLAICDRNARTATMYSRWQKLGFEFGPAFQTLNSVRYNQHGIAISTVQPSAKSSPTLKQCIHPTSLDAMLQAVLPAISCGGTKRVPTFVPTGIPEMWISNDGNHIAANKPWEVAASSRFAGSRNVMSNVIACSLDGSEVYAWMRNIQATAINTLEPEQQSSINPCFRITWKPDLDVINDNNSIAKYCTSREGFMSNGNQAVGDVEIASFIYLARLLRAIQDQQIRFSKPHFARYVDWARRQLQRLEQDQNLHEQIVSSGILDSQEKQQAVLNRLSGGGPDAILCARIGENVEDLVAGRQDAINLLFQDTLLDDFYLWSITEHSRFERLAKLLDLAAHKNPSMDILEIGAGTGSGTVSALQILSSAASGVKRYGHYTFTDISPSFFEKAQGKLTHDVDHMTFKTLDISKDPFQQGFVANSFDMILAVNVLHATPDISNTLSNVRKLLKVGGKLFLVENTQIFAVKTGFVFGVLPDWWLERTGSRRWGALLNETDWTCALAKNGFSGADLCLSDNDDSQHHISNIIVATAIAEEPIRTISNGSLDQERIAIVVPGRTGQQEGFDDLLRRSVESGLGMKCDIVTSQAALSHRYIIYLLELDQPVFTAPTHDLLATLRSSCKNNRRILWITRSMTGQNSSPAYSMVTGWARSLRTEIPSLQLVTMALERPESSIDLLANVVHVISGLVRGDDSSVEEEYVERDGMFYIPRIMPDTKLDVSIQPDHVDLEPEMKSIGSLDRPTLKLTISVLADQDSSHFVYDDSTSKPLAKDEVDIEIAAVGLSSHDLALFHGQHVRDQDTIGLEGSGRVKRLSPSYSGDLRPGDRVAGLFNGSARTVARTKTSLIAPVPIDVDYKAAASIPMAYCTAFYALFDIAKFDGRQSLLIHYDSRGVGDAILQLTNTKSRQIFVTIDREETRKSLQDRYGISDDNILSSRDPFLDESIQTLTAGRGVDLCISMYSGEIARRSIRCVSPFGQFIDITSDSSQTSTSHVAESFARSVMLTSVNIGLMMREIPDRLSQILRTVMRLMDKALASAAQPAAFGFSELQSAIQQSLVEKTVIEFRQEDQVLVTPKPLPAYVLDPAGSYVIAGLGGLGRSITRWLVSRGAKNILLLSRSGSKPTVNRRLIEEIRSQDVRVLAPECDVSDSQSLSQVLQDIASDMPPIKGCIQAAMVLRDSLFENMTLRDFKAAADPKVAGSWNLHTLLPTDLDFFIMLSSLNGIIPFSGQSNYAAGNTYQDALAEFRIRQGQKAISIDLGIMADVGYVAEHEDKVTTAAQAYNTISETSLHCLLEHYCNAALPLATPEHSQVLFGLTTAATILNRTGDPPHWQSRTLCRALANMPADNDSDEPTASNTTNTTSQSSANGTSGPKPKSSTRKTPLKALLPSTAAAQRPALILSTLTQKLSRALAVAVDELDPHRSMNSYGTDSLVAVEIKNWALAEVGVEIAIFEILDNATLAGFAALLLERWEQSAPSTSGAGAGDKGVASAAAGSVVVGGHKSGGRAPTVNGDVMVID